MTNSRSKRGLLSLALPALVTALIGAAAMPAAAAAPVTVVELFTSQGCSSCPPANANLIELNKRDDVLALSFAVTYWDYLGWKDSFGKPEFTERQRVYEPPLKQANMYTPQMVINGASTAVGINLAEVTGLIDSAKPLAGPAISTEAGSLTIGAGKAPSAGADVWLVSYDAGIVDVPVGRGENTGRTLPHTHVVHSLQHLGTWDGSAASFTLAKAGAGLSTAVLVQTTKGGPILSASVL